MPGSVLYLGDTNLHDAAAYLAGLLSAWEWDFDYVSSDQPATEADFASERALFVLSDYPAANVSDALQQKLLQQVHAGAGLIMVGGWESFHGCGGDWDSTSVAAALPVEIADADDRVNCDRPVLVCRSCDHPCVSGLPWEVRPPVIGGFNRVRPKTDATVVLEAQIFDARRAGNAFAFTPAEREPLLVVGEYGTGRTAALATDVAPHWVGPLVDWGDGRVSAQAPSANEVEVGDWYARFLRQLLGWVGKIE